jgi:hypothetical protein
MSVLRGRKMQKNFLTVIKEQLEQTKSSKSKTPLLPNND